MLEFLYRFWSSHGSAEVPLYELPKEHRSGPVERPVNLQKRGAYTGHLGHRHSKKKCFITHREGSGSSPLRWRGSSVEDTEATGAELNGRVKDTGRVCGSKGSV